jgi:hypothetical protein
MNKQLLIIILAIVSCKPQNKQNNIQGTWKLFSATLVENGDTTNTAYADTKSFIKIINNTHFAFLSHDLKHGKDTATAQYTSGGGKYQLSGNKYTEHLEYCTDRAWEAHDFEFTINIKNDTLIQQGVETVPEKNINRLNVERYILLKN